MTYLGEARKAGAEVRALSTVTRVLTNQDGTKRHRRRILRRQEAKAGAGGERRHPGGLVGAKPAPAAQFGDRQASEGSRQQERAGRQVHDDAITSPAPGRCSTRTSRRTWARSARSSCRMTAMPRRAIRARSARSFIVAGAAMKTNDYAQARGDLFGAELAAFMKRAARGITRITIFGEGLPQLENRVELVERQGRVRHAAGAADPQLRRRRASRCGTRISSRA